ncbi:hypothetical protein GOB33_18860 [Sinorhizobium meliloti]|nr:hypothetical protein [Sinorhizobium meliloti]
MKQTLKAGPTPQTWDAESLFLKAQRYAEKMAEADSDTWDHALWSSLALELLARAALANVNPALLAEVDKNWSSLFSALGFEPTDKKFVSKSIPVAEVFRRLAAIFPETFVQEQESFCTVHTGRRNAELHSGDAAFEGVSAVSWQPRFYSSCKSLLATMGLGLTDFIPSSEADVAEKLIAAAADHSAKAVQDDVAAHKKVWLSKGKEERASLDEAAKLWATRQAGHRVNCPACESTALLRGEPIAPAVRKLNAEDDEIVETQEYLPSQFECVACQLKILGLSRLGAVGLAGRFKNTQVYDAAEFYAPDDDYHGYEEDNNEPF